MAIGCSSGSNWAVSLALAWFCAKPAAGMNSVNVMPHPPICRTSRRKVRSVVPAPDVQVKLPGLAFNAATAQAANAAKKTGSNWLAWIIPLLIAAAAAWYFLGGMGHSVKEAAEKAADSATSLVVDGVDVNAQLTSAFDGLKSTLGGITDAASAQAALPKLQEAVTSVDGLTAVAAKLTPAQRTMMSGVITAALPTLKDLIAKVVAIPGVGDVVKPTTDALLAKIEALANPA